MSDHRQSEISRALLLTIHSLPYYFVRPRQDIRRNRETDLLYCLEVDDQLKLRRLLHWDIGGFGSFENLVHLDGCAPDYVIVVCPIGYKSTCFHPFFILEYCRQAILCQKIENSSLMSQKAYIH